MHIYFCTIDHAASDVNLRCIMQAYPSIHSYFSCSHVSRCWMLFQEQHEAPHAPSNRSPSTCLEHVDPATLTNCHTAFIPREPLDTLIWVSQSCNHDCFDSFVRFGLPITIIYNRYKHYQQHTHLIKKRTSNTGSPNHFFQLQRLLSSLHFGDIQALARMLLLHRNTVHPLT